VFEAGLGGLTRLRISSALSEAGIYLQGAHLDHFRPVDAAPLLFLSDDSLFAPGKPIRGGVPVCFPWFGPHPQDSTLPAHGFARISEWEVESLTGSMAAGVTVVFRLTSNAETRALWPHDFVARLRIEATEQLVMTLEVENPSAIPIQFEEALHTYFEVSDVRQVSVTGLEGAAYFDKTDGMKAKHLSREPLLVVLETDRIFPANQARCIIDDPGSPRRIIVEKSGSNSTVVWNPWVAKAAALPDFGDDEWPRMLCIETANVTPDAVTLAPGARHAMSAIIRLA
ncbi:MAG TPA: D-hexose-6-phosphate mutarotase, partial [Chthoniobacteraceae bacterium]